MEGGRIMANYRKSGNEAVAYAIKQINPDVMPAYPITPSTEIPQMVSQYIANGEMDTVFIPVESEHSAMSATISASMAGARSISATSSAGFALMFEVLGIAASDRLPIALALVTRALTGPININCDHSDAMAGRDTGWIMLFAENNQEAYDNMVMAYRIAEHKDVRLPIMICQDGFITSHSVQNIELLEDDEVKKFVGEYEPEHYALNADESVTYGPYSSQDYYLEARKAQSEAMKNVVPVALDVMADFEKLSGRSYGLFEEYRMEDAERAIVCIGSMAGTTKDAVDELREAGEKVGLIKLRFYRPFPGKQLAEALRNVKAVAIMDRAESNSTCGGPLGAELMAAMFREKLEAGAINYICGLGGRDISVNDIKSVYADLEEVVKTGDAGETYRYLGLRE